MPTRGYQITGGILILETLPSDPPTGVVGQLYYNTTIDRPKVYTASDP